jgi:hypothetical protein
VAQAQQRNESYLARILPDPLLLSAALAAKLLGIAVRRGRIVHREINPGDVRMGKYHEEGAPERTCAAELSR